MTGKEEQKKEQSEEVYMKGTGFEVIGVRPIPRKARYMSPGKIFIFWAMASASATTPLIGYLLQNLGLYNLIIAFTISLLIGLLPAGLFSGMGRQFPVPALIVSRKTYGYLASNALSALYTVVNVGWFGLNDATGGLIVASLTHTDPVIWFILFGIIQIVLVLYGAKLLEYFYRYTAALLIVCYAILTYFLFTYFPINWDRILSPSGDVNWGLSVGLVLSFSILAWTYKISTATRFAKPQDTDKSLLYLISAPLGIMVPVYLMGILGLFSQTMAGNWNLPAVTFPVSGTIIGVIIAMASIGASLAILHTNAMNLYPAVADLLTALQSAFKSKNNEKMAQPISTIILGLAGAIAASLGILQNAVNFLLFVGDVIFPYTFILLIDWYVRLWPSMRSGKLTEENFYSFRKTVQDNLNVYAVIATVIGTVLNVVNISALNPLFSYFPQELFGSLIGALLYYVFLRTKVVK
ncbi:thiamine permease [Candidatus Acidianus copahuensis]|uniref:Thiamine permease n=1 Tax=Candidatus Acidianus copahuensis TaxID=1160895 RepID=A0A031LWK8_9CREN|nr:cytosine permease [Candidatus Acidianus copahuensis]EZQ11528.1 thiamine permease [Candidatus Acidianus copahuensis]